MTFVCLVHRSIHFFLGFNFNFEFLTFSHDIDFFWICLQNVQNCVFVFLSLPRAHFLTSKSGFVMSKCFFSTSVVCLFPITSV